MSFTSDRFAVSPSDSGDIDDGYETELRQDGCSSSLADTESSLHQTEVTTISLMEERESPPPALLISTYNSAATGPDNSFTASNLAQHDQHMEDTTFYVDDEEDQRLLGDHVENLRLALQSMHIELPECILVGMASNYNGMSSLERLLTEYEDSISAWTMREEYYTQNHTADFHAYDALGEELHDWEEG